MRSELLVKLALLLRRSEPAAKLLAAQHETFAPIEAALEQQVSAGTEFDGILATWRLENVRAALRFLADASNQVPRPRARTQSPTRSPQH
jgi:hypothetical protein